MNVSAQALSPSICTLVRGVQGHASPIDVCVITCANARASAMRSKAGYGVTLRLE